MSTIAGLVIVTVSSAAPRVASRCVGLAGLTLAGGDGDSRLAAVWEGEDGEALETFADQLIARDGEILGVFPTSAGTDGE